MKVLFVASECSPIVKVGGLGDVVGSLPKALTDLGIEVVIAIPAYQTIDFSSWKEIGKYLVHFNSQPLKVTVFLSSLPGSNVVVWAFREEKYIASGGVYFSKTAFSSSQDEIERFVVFNKAVAKWVALSQAGFDLVHAHDWHTGALLRFLDDEQLAIKKVFTIHNLANQGLSTLEIDKKLSGELLKDKLYQWDALDHSFNLMMQGIIGADWITTVSPSYAKEILTPLFGEKLEEILHTREGRITGILNGIDYSVWDPQSDKYLTNHFNQMNWFDQRPKNKTQLRETLNLPETDAPVIGFIGRLTNQKGLDLILGGLNRVLDRAQLVVLGRGQADIVAELTEAAGRNPRQMAYINTDTDFHEDYEHLMYGACDFILAPSRFEPCGLIQMFAMHYGAVPVVHAVGGLKDTVRERKTGFLFADYTVANFLRALIKALDIFGTAEFTGIVASGMRYDFSWRKSAAEYAKLYEKVLKL
jgi:starch synthase